MNIRLFFRSALLSTILAYLLIFIGGLVRVSGAGMGCPNWPKCGDNWIPPTNVDFEQFNLTLAWIEFINRSFGAILGISIIVLCFLSIKYFYSNKKILSISFLSLFLVITNGVVGGALVWTNLNPFIKTFHMILALALVSSLSFLTVESYKNLRDKKIILNSASLPNKKIILIFAFLIIIEILLGTGIRTNIEIIQTEFPLLNKSEQLDSIPFYKYFHAFLGFTLLFLSFYLYKKFSNHSLRIIKSLNTFILCMIIVQILLGELLVFFELPQLARLFHTWGSSWLVGISVIYYNLIDYELA